MADRRLFCPVRRLPYGAVIGFRDRVVVCADVKVEGHKLNGMQGIVVDTPGEEPIIDSEMRFVRFPPTHSRGEFFAWVREKHLKQLIAQPTD